MSLLIQGVALPVVAATIYAYFASRQITRFAELTLCRCSGCRPLHLLGPTHVTSGLRANSGCQKNLSHLYIVKFLLQYFF